jgi:hypothetical protein
MNFAALAILASTVLAQASSPITGAVVDDRGKPVSGAEVVFSSGVARDGSVPIVAKTTTDETGRFRIEHPGASRRGGVLDGAIWAHKPGPGLGVVELIREDQPGRSHRLVLEPAQARHVTIRDADGKPIKGARIAPRVAETDQTSYLGATVPDVWLERLTAASDDKGIAALPGLTRRSELRSAWIAIPGGGSHIVMLPMQSAKDDAVTLTLGHPARLVGEVKRSSGGSVAGAEIEVWVRCGSPFGDQQAWYSIPARVMIDGGPIRTDALGSFKTSPALLIGSTYRVVVRAAGHSPSVSDWVTLKNESNSLQPIVVHPLRTISGRAVDRQGNPVAGVQIFEPAGGPFTTTDEAGLFKLEGARSGRWLLLARQAGFRFQGRLIDSTATQTIELVLSREHEQPDRMMATLPELLSLEESRALARRVIGPYLKEVTAKGDDPAKFRVLDIERWLNPAALLEQVQKTRFDYGFSADFLRGRAAVALVDVDSDEAAAIAETIVDPGRRAGTLVDLVDALPAKELPRKLALLDRAALQIRSAALTSNKLYQMGEVAERWLELGESAKAKVLFTEARKLVETLPPLKRGDAGSFAAHLARVEPAEALALVKDIMRERGRQRVLGNIASRLAFEHPAEAERALSLIEEPIWRIWCAPRICRRLARNDVARARRIAAGLPYPTERAYAWTFIADGLTGSDGTGASAALDQALREIDSIDLHDPYRRFDPNPAVSILPLVERIAPDRVAEVFWRAVALHAPGDDPRGDFGGDHPLVSEVMLLSRYDRDVAATLFEPVAAYVRSRPLRGDQDIKVAVHQALACLDPKNAVAVVESMPPARTLKIGEPGNYARYDLAEILAMPPARRWMRIWRDHAGCGTAMFEEVYREF